MANFAELVEWTKEALQDAGDIEESDVKTLLNEAYQEITDEVQIPSLKKMTTVSTVVSQAWANMPEGFSGKLRYVGNSSGAINILDGGLEQLLEDYPGLTQEGTIEAVAVQGTLLYYQGIPTEAEELIVLYYEDVDPMEADDDTPSHLPEYLHRQLLVHKAAHNKYKVIEDGIEGEKVNTVKHLGYYLDAKGKMDEWLARRRRHNHRSIWDK